MSLFSFLDESARRYGAEAAVFHGTRRHATYTELRQRALALGAGVGAQGRAGERGSAYSWPAKTAQNILR
jgi:non-ribosomal peptide synthetase component E (peptide arylation enzyme)